MLLVFLALSILVITIDYRAGDGGILKTAKQWSMAVVAPIQRGFTTVFRPVGDFFSALGDIPDLQDENRRLKEQVKQMQAENDQADAARDENVQLRAEMNLPKSWWSEDTVAAETFATAAGNYSRAIMINKGSNDGIDVDMPVVTSDGLVGKVLNVSPTTSQVLLLTDPRGGAGARILGVGDTGVVQGDGDDTLAMNFVGKNADVSAGDQVITSGQGEGGGLQSIFPSGIPIGTVSRVEIQGGQTTKDVEVTTSVEFSKLHFVTVLLTDPTGAGSGTG